MTQKRPGTAETDARVAATDSLTESLALELYPELQRKKSSVGGYCLQRERGDKKHNLLEFEHHEEVLTHAAAVGGPHMSESQRWEHLVRVLQKHGLTIKDPTKTSGLYSKWYWEDGGKPGELFRFSPSETHRVRAVVKDLLDSTVE